MALTFNGSTSKLVLSGISPMVSAYPVTLLAWKKTTTAAANQGIFMHGDNSNTEFVRSLVSASAGRIRGSASGFQVDSANGTVTGSWKLAMYVCTGATNRVQYYSVTGGDTTDTANGTPVFANFNQVWVGMLPGDLFPFSGDLAECHIFNTALTTTDFANLAADSVKPEAISGWVDGWTLIDAATLTSIGGTRTLTATNVTTASGGHPIAGRSGGGPGVTIANLEHATGRGAFRGQYVHKESGLLLPDQPLIAPRARGRIIL